VVRYSFLVRLFHPLLHAGLSRRTVMASRVENRRSDGSLPVDIRRGFRRATSVRFGLVLFPVPAHRTGQADFPHPALGKDSRCCVRRRLQLLNTNCGVARLIVNPHVLRCFLRLSLTEVPSLRRSYPASSVLRTSPPPHTARPVSRELPVDPYRDHRWGFPCCVWSPMRTCRRHYPGRFNGAYSLVALHCRRLSP
jgi:hypothetical protein